MEWCRLVFLLPLLLLHLVDSVQSAATLESDASALGAISKGFKSSQLQWSGDDPCATRWTGVTCQSYNVTKLILNSMDLSGRLLPSIGNLQNLETLDLSFNPQLSGQLPKTLGSLTNLKVLNLQACAFTGSIPFELGMLKKLEFLGLNLNKLEGSIPPELGGLSSVYWFDLAENRLSGNLPVSSGNSQKLGLDNLTAALHFHLNGNMFSGPFPSEICFLGKLIHLLLDSNTFTGEIPDEVGNLPKLTIMRIDKNGFTGQIPSSIGNISTLTELHANDNAFTGTIPDLTGLTKLQLLTIGNNMFDPQPVPSFTGMSSLQTLEINQGNLTGPISRTLFKLPSLETVSLMKNIINGTPDFVDASPSLVSVQLDDNQIEGLALTGDTQFTLSLSGNPVCQSGRYSPEICASKTQQNYRGNRTCGETCPDQKTTNQNTCVCAYPLTINFQFNAPSFSSINSSRVDILRQVLAEGLNLTIDQLWVDSANFTSDKRLHLRLFIFPPNGQDKFTVPTTSFIISMISTHKLKTDFYGPYALTVSTPPGEVKGGKGLSVGTKVGIAIAAVIGILLIAGAGIYAFSQKRRADKAIVSSNPFASWGSRGGKDSGSAPQLKGARFFSVADLRKATDNFSSSNELGRGGYGKVYKGTLSTGEEVAIKRAQEGSLQGATEFKTEIELLSRVHHRNLVGLIGFCYEHGEQMLVYEYMPNGTIREHLPDRLGTLSWRKRLEIAVGSAKGIAYLHELANPPIIHRDIKSSNILLDEKYIAKVADFGLSKLAPTTDDKGHVSTQVKGTLGYLDPEYYMTQQLTEKSDVYSFGVVLLELITAKQPIEHGKYIVREVRAALDRGFSYFLSMLDPYLKDYPREDLEKFLVLALSCVDESANKRPTMSEVVKELEILLSHISSSGFSRETSENRNYLKNLYDDSGNLSKAEDPSFQYSGGFPHSVEPK